MFLLARHMLPVRILGTGHALPPRAVSTAELVRNLGSVRSPEDMERRIGIRSRRWVAEGETVTTLALSALRSALAAAALAPEDLRRIILATSTGGDQLIPSTASNLVAALGLSDTCDAFDVNNACTGFLTALDIAARSVATDLGPVAVIGAEVLSRYLAPPTPRSYLVLADGAGAVILGAGSGSGGVRASHLRVRRDLSGPMRTLHPGVTGLPSAITFDAPLDELARSAVAAISDASNAALAAAGLGWPDVTWFLSHQPNGVLFDTICEACGVPPERTIPIAAELGSLAAASVPISLDRLWRSGRVRPGDHLLLAAVGAGTGYGAMVIQVE